MAPIYSMTAFSRESASANNGELTVELRSVNHRYLDCSFKLPDALRNAEAGLRERATARLSRGKLDCLFRFQSGTVRAAGLVVDHRQVQKVVNAALEVSALLP
ncbi:MAG: hypothetical protein NWQ24_03810, partial [Haliea sp.]|nr:hypothetical protein [Haliea sp.]